MSRQANLSILGLWRYDHDVFKNLIVPDGLNKEDVVNTIIMEYNGLECLYPDPDTMKEFVGTWSRSKIEGWSMMYKALTADYNPIENYDRHEDVKDNETVNGGSTSNTNVKNARTSFESYSPQLTDGGDSNTKTAGNNNRNYDHTAHIHGNIGVTTNQQMIEAELNLRKNTMITLIATEFKEEFLIALY